MQRSSVYLGDLFLRIKEFKMVKTKKSGVKKQKIYQKEDLGAMLVFLLPSLKLKKKIRDNISLEDKIHHFLLEKFNGYTAAAGNIFGYWRNKAGKEFYGEHKEYKVSLLQKKEIKTLESFLAGLALEMEEESIYLSLGGKSWLIYP